MFRFFLLPLLGSLCYGLPQFRPQLDGRIVGGHLVAIEEYPYQVSFLYYGSHICGGTIISSKYVVTAAHCTDGAEGTAYSVRVGTSVKNLGGEVVPVAKVHQHPDFDLWNVDYDISILELGKELEFGPTVGKVALPEANATLEAGSVSVATGWGHLSEGGSTSKILQAVELPIVDQQKCKFYYGTTQITDRMFCAGVPEGGKDTCQGDSGGPLVLDGKLVGIISWGFGCARPNMPGVYSSVPSLRGYIRQVTGI